MLRISCVLFLCVLLPHVIFAQVMASVSFDELTGNYVIRYQGSQGPIEVTFIPATKIDPVVEARVTKSHSTFLYSYVVENLATSQQRLLSFRLQFSVPISTITKPNQEWSSEPSGLIPGWLWTNDMIDPYGAKSPFNGIPPDSSLNGFSFGSLGLPSVTTSYFRGATPTLFFPEEPPREVEDLLRPLEGFPANEVQRRSIGPKAPPDPFVPDEFLDMLVSYKHQALELGWIDNQGIANSLNAKLDNVKKQLQKGKTNTAQNVLKAFLNEVEAQKDKHLSSEAYALLKFNGEFLLSKL